MREGSRVRMSRAWLHYEAALGVIAHFGHTAALDKLVPPCLDMVYLGVTLDLSSSSMSLSSDKCDAYGQLVSDMLSRHDGGGSLAVEAADLAAILHRLLHAAAVLPLGRQHLFHLMRAAKTRTRLLGGRRMLQERALSELSWWSAMLRRPSCTRGVPLAFRTTFPSSADPSVMVPYSDASRELASADQSGFGAWAILCGVFCYVEGRWSEEELLLHDINSLELAAMNIGTFSLLAEARRRQLPITHVLEFTDNTSAEHASEGGKPKSTALGELVRRRYDAFAEQGIFASATRVSSEDNDVADGLSRGGEQLADALRMAASAGFDIVRVDVLGRWRSLDGLRN